jgi:hypothetical protein
MLRRILNALNIRGESDNFESYYQRVLTHSDFNTAPTATEARHDYQNYLRQQIVYRGDLY